jgi:hypothetical protein
MEWSRRAAGADAGDLLVHIALSSNSHVSALMVHGDPVSVHPPNSTATFRFRSWAAAAE